MRCTKSAKTSVTSGRSMYSNLTGGAFFGSCAIETPHQACGLSSVIEHAVPERRAALVDAVAEVMHQRIDVGSSHVRIGGKVRRRVEAARRIASFMPAVVVIVIERIDMRRRDVGVGGEIAVGV